MSHRVQQPKDLGISSAERPPPAIPALTQVWKNNALSIVLTALFLGSVTLQVHFGQAVYNEQRLEAGRSAVSLGEYLTSGHFVEALFERPDSETSAA